MIEVHLILGKTKTDHFNPKAFEQARRDKLTSSTHEHKSFDPTTDLTYQAWSNLLECRKCKASLIQGIGSSFFQTSSKG